MTGRPQLGPRLAAVDRAIARAITAIHAHPDRGEALRAAERLRVALGDAEADAARERAVAAYDLWNAGRLTLLELAQDHLGGVSEERARQVRNAGRDHTRRVEDDRKAGP